MSMNEDLSPSDKLSDIHLEFAGMEQHSNSPHGDFMFRFVQRREGQEKLLATISFPVRDAHDGFPGMMGRACDQMISVLRQGLFTAAKLRTHYRFEAQTRYPRERI